jgi:hypothetical protein
VQDSNKQCGAQYCSIDHHTVQYGAHGARAPSCCAQRGIYAHALYAHVEGPGQGCDRKLHQPCLYSAGINACTLPSHTLVVAQRHNTKQRVTAFTPLQAGPMSLPLCWAAVGLPSCPPCSDHPPASPQLQHGQRSACCKYLKQRGARINQLRPGTWP